MKRADSLSKRLAQDIEVQKGLMTNIEDIPELTMNFQPNYHQTQLETQHLSLQIQDKSLFADLNLIVKNQGVISLEGKNGAGKSTFLKLLLNKANDVFYQGKYLLPKDLRISYLPQDFSQYTGTLKVFAKNKEFPMKNFSIS